MALGTGEKRKPSPGGASRLETICSYRTVNWTYISRGLESVTIMVESMAEGGRYGVGRVADSLDSYFYVKGMERLGLEWVFKTSKSNLSDTLPPTKQYVLILPSLAS